MLKKHKILVVDDDQSLQSIIEMRLRHAGYEVEKAADGEEAMSCMKKSPPRVVFLDIMMPGMDGFEVLDRIKKDRKTRNVPVVMLTSKNGGEDVQKAMSLGAKDYIVEPFRPGILVEKIKKVTGRR